MFCALSTSHITRTSDSKDYGLDRVFSSFVNRCRDVSIANSKTNLQFYYLFH